MIISVKELRRLKERARAKGRARHIKFLETHYLWLLDDNFLFNNKFKELIESIPDILPYESDWNKLKHDIELIRGDIFTNDFKVEIEEYDLLINTTLYYKDKAITSKTCEHLSENEYKMRKLLAEKLKEYRTITIEDMSILGILCYTERYEYSTTTNTRYWNWIKKIKNDLILPYLSEEEYEKIKAETIYKGYEYLHKQY